MENGIEYSDGNDHSNLDCNQLENGWDCPKCYSYNITEIEEIIICHDCRIVTKQN